MRHHRPAAVCLLLFLSLAAPALCQPEEAGTARSTDQSKAEIIENLEARYRGADIQADFIQESTLAAMDITDTAKGKVWFKHPGMMRWEYETPDAHAIISDGETLWIHRPADNQVIVGDALAYFGDGKGASFLSNIGLIKEVFSVEKVPSPNTGSTNSGSTDTGDYTLKLVPREKELDLSEIHLTVNKKTFTVESVTTENAYGDENRIKFRNIRFKDSIPEAKFRFEIPEGADVMQMSE